MLPAGLVNEKRSIRVPYWRRFALALLVLLVGMTVANGQIGRPLRIYLAASTSSFNLVEWEVRSVSSRLDRILGGLIRPPAPRSGDTELGRSFLLAPPPARAAMRAEAEAALERQLTASLRSEGIGNDLSPTGVFPPVSLRFVAPPSVLIVAPRDRLVVEHSLFLAPSLDQAAISQIEQRVDALGVSALVTPIGGLGTYPSMVVDSGRPTDLLSSVAHEWVHAYLAFHPLGRAYWSNQEARSLNETVAELVGKELGDAMARELGVATPAQGRPRPAPDQRFQTEMRQTRLEVERLIAAGRIDYAEDYMEQRRLELNELGFPIRRLNQAYFAFYGSYAESGAGDNRMARLVQQARAESGSLDGFLRSVRTLQSLDKLEALINDSGTANPQGEDTDADA